MMEKRKISKTMSYLLRHDPEGMGMDGEGWVEVAELLARLHDRDLDVNPDRLREVVETDPKGRYELAERRIRARYGHSVNHVDPSLTPADRDTLFHGTDPDNLDRIRSQGLQSQGRQKVHLSATKEEARTVGARHAAEPVLLTVDAAAAQQDGIRIERASDVVYVANHVPPAYITFP